MQVISGALILIKIRQKWKMVICVETCIEYKTKKGSLDKHW